jgi:hypothetical protein
MKTTITNKILTPVLAVLAMILFDATIGTAAPGDLDPTFGIGGKVIDGSGYGLYDVAIQPDGKSCPLEFRWEDRKVPRLP